jgi:hypothetical protein
MTIKPLLAISFLSTLIALSGCGGSSSSSSSYDANSQTNVAFANSSKFNYAQVSIVNSAGKETLFIDNINCPSGSTNCFINLNTALNAGDSLLFKNASGVMVAAITAAQSSSGYRALSPSAMSTGFYLINRLSSELLSESGIAWIEFNQRTLTFFTNYDSTDGTIDLYEEVGDYYFTRITKAAASERAFLDAFKLRLLNWDVANNNELPNQTSFTAGLYNRFWTFLNKNSFSIVSPAHAQANTCAPGLKSFLEIAGNVGNVIPVVGDGISALTGLGSDYCDDTDAKLDKISTQLNNLQTSVLSIASKVGEISKFLSRQEANDKTTEFQKTANEALDLYSNYKKFLKDNGDVKSLQEFFAKQGGWDKGKKEGGARLLYILGSPFKGGDNLDLYTNILNTTGRADFETYLLALQTRCSQLNVSSKDNFIITRQQCNNIILANSGRLVAAQGLALPIFKDIFTTLATYNEQVKNDYVLPSGLTSFAAAYKEAEAAFSSQQRIMIDQYKGYIGGIGFFNTFAGLDTTLTSNLVKRECNQSNEATRNKSPAISGWYAPTTNDKQNYIETSCKVGSLDKRVKARYYIGDQGSGVDANDVANVLGVPVAAEYTTFFSDYIPLYFTTLGLANRTRIEVLDRTTNPLYLEAISISAAASFESPFNRWNYVISPNQSKVRTAYGNINYEVPITSGSLSYWYVLVPSQSDYYRVARVKISNLSDSTNGYTFGTLECIAPPCRVDPATDQWIIFTENGETLDLKSTTRSFNGRKIARLAPVGQ